MRRRSEADTQPRLNELLSSRPARATLSDPQAMHEHLLQKALLAHDIERRCIAEFDDFVSPGAEGVAECNCMWMVGKVA